MRSGHQCSDCSWKAKKRKIFYFDEQDIIDFTNTSSYVFRDTGTGTTGTTAVAPKF